ncbi:EAL domain-containing protein [Psychrobacter sp. I-STPA6b]|uniref:EAL domain-containing protein n=1 Tax=Psychrobacter sp. I-STPA6b TaxID=2585718 RepID=UPI001D0CA807|nr:GGDEF domain-containing phosphodiesterase [Psychrobacter sp. I-STPA6b]
MTTQSTLNLLVVDDNQLYAERIVALLSHYYDEVNLGFLDDKEELLRLLRHSWDVLIFGKAYDMGFTDIVGIIQEQGIDLPLICLLNENIAATSINEEGMPATIDEKMVKALLADNEAQVVIATCMLHSSLEVRRQMAGLKYVLSEAEQRANILIKNSKSAVAYIDQGIHIFANEPYLKLFGFSNMDELMGIPVIDLIAGGENIKAFKQFLRRFDKGNRDKVEFNFESRRKDGSTFEATLQLAAATFEGEPVTQVIIQQSGEDNAEMARKLAAAERRDNLTGLLNRRGFEERFAQVYVEAKAGKTNAALLYISLDGIGKINSNLGLQGVDETVKQVGYVLDETLDSGEVSRFSDSNFTVLFPDIIQSKLLEQAEAVRQKISDMLIEIGTRTVTTTVTIGMVIVDNTSPDMSVLIDRAMDAREQAFKDSGKEGNAIHLYDPSQHASEDEMVLAEYLQSALTNSQFKLLYQPIYDIETDSSHFFEVYLRLPLADGTLMTPDKFLPVAKKYNLMDKIDRWVLINTCKQLSIVRKQIPDAKALVQLTSQSLASKQIAGVISQLLKAVGGQDGVLTVQFNEQELVDHMAVAKKQFSMLKQVGCQVAIHHFGSTAKTIEVMEFVQPSMVRLARSYVKNLGDANNVETVKSLIAKVNERSTPALMPYIEDAAAMSAAWSVGARYLQGYYLQEPSEKMMVQEGEAT